MFAASSGTPAFWYPGNTCNSPPLSPAYVLFYFSLQTNQIPQNAFAIVVCHQLYLCVQRPIDSQKEKHGLFSSIHPLCLCPACLALLYVFCLITLSMAAMLDSTMEYSTHAMHWKQLERMLWKRDARCSGWGDDTGAHFSEVRLGRSLWVGMCSKVKERRARYSVLF